jgi:hypothetical protein
LCWGCYNTPGVRDLYRSTSKFASRKVGLGHAPGRLPAEPTSAPPGSEAKVQVMCERAARRENLFHPDDAPLDMSLLAGKDGAA